MSSIRELHLLPEEHHRLLHIQATDDFEFSGWCFASPYVEAKLKARMLSLTVDKVSNCIWPAAPGSHTGSNVCFWPAVKVVLQE